jgi:hypothetical protein
MLGINLGHHYLPTYQILMISGNVEFLPPIFYTVFWQPFWKWQTSRKFWKCRIAWTEFHETLWSYRYMFLVDPKVFSFVVKGVKVIFWGGSKGVGVTIESYGKVEISYINVDNVVEIGQCWICAVLWWPFWKWRPVEIFLCQESIRDIIIFQRHFICG